MKDWSLVYLISEWSIRLVMFIYVPQRRSTAAARTWLLFIFLLPWPGLLLYWLFGRIYLPAHRLNMQERASKFVRRAQEQIGARVAVDPELPAAFRRNAARFDLRNHRKIVVVDGRVAYTGSQNIVDPGFVKGYSNEELMVRLTGPGVALLQAMFLADHYFETGKVLDRKELFPELVYAGNSPVQVLPSGPGYGQENGRELIIAMLYAARERIVITTPYFVPDEPFLQAIRAASMREGIEVHLVLSMHANQMITQFAQRSYYDDLLGAGIRIHLYRPRFLHAKHLTIDNDIALIGSTNMDIRSFALNAEVNLLVYDSSVVQQLRVVQERYFADSDRLEAAGWDRRPLRAKVIHNTARLMDSFL